MFSCKRRTRNLFIKKNFILILLFLAGNVIFADETIKAQNNAYLHNNKGLIYLEENYYFGAIKEFQMAIDLNPNSQASAVFYYNLGNTYEKIGYPALARPCFEKALQLNVLYFDYYLKLAENYKKLGIAEEKLNEFQQKKSTPLNNIFIGLLFIKTGKTKTGITVLDDFCDKEPKLIITNGVKNYIKQLTKDNN